MLNINGLSLRKRFIITNIVLVFTIVSILSTIQLYNFNQNSREVLSEININTSASLISQVEQRGVILLDYLSESLVNPLYQFDLEATYRLLKPAVKNSEIVSVIVFDSSGNIFHDGTKFSESFATQYAEKDVLHSVITLRELHSSIVGEQLKLAKPIYIGGELLGGLALTFSLDMLRKDISYIESNILQINDKSLKMISVLIFISGLLCSVVGILFSVLISRSLIAPIRDLVPHSRRIMAGDFTADNQISRQDEIGELARSFNEMGHSLKHRTEEISFLAYHDSLTKLPNRAMFIKTVSRLSLIQPCFTVMFLDLDEFKFVNDNYGHEAGDDLLCEIARRISENLRVGDVLINTGNLDEDEMVARIGGDEFLICLPNIDNVDDAKAIAGRLISSIRSPVEIHHDEVVVAASIGIASYPADATTAEELIKKADIAMYQAKKSGKNTCINFQEAMNQEVKRRIEVEQDLRKALEDTNQFELWFQPQVELATGRLVGAEALIRWHHPEKGLIYPDDFISIAEETGLILPVGEWVIETACEQLQLWQPYLPEDFYIAVNLSAKQVYRSNAVSIFHDALEKYGCSAKQLHVEVTESVLMKDEVFAEDTLSAIRNLGMQVWLDDFGTGYSSLAYLKKFQVDGVKIDRSFVSDIENDAYDRALTSSIIDIAANLNIAVIAEGIETRCQLEFLQEKGCYVGQDTIIPNPLVMNCFTGITCLAMWRSLNRVCRSLHRPVYRSGSDSTEAS